MTPAGCHQVREAFRSHPPGATHVERPAQPDLSCSLSIYRSQKSDFRLTSMFSCALFARVIFVTYLFSITGMRVTLHPLRFGADYDESGLCGDTSRDRHDHC